MNRALNFLTRPLPVLLLLSLLATLIYSNTFSVPFVFDDTDNIPQNPKIRNLANFIDFSGRRYVGFLSFALNHHFGALNLFSYHLINLLIHIANGFLAYCLVMLVYKTSQSRFPTNNPQPDTARWIAMATALFFISHPIQTQAVTYIIQRFTSLAALFYILTMVCYLKWRLTPSDAKSRYLWYGGALLSTVLAMKTKEISFTLPLMLLLAEITFFRPFTKKRWISMMPFLLTLLIVPFSRTDLVGEAEAGLARQTAEISRLDYLFTQFRVIITYLRLLFLPINQNLDYDYPIYHSLLVAPVLSSFLFLLVLFASALYLLFNLQFRTYHPRFIAFGILWFFLTLSIESSIIPIRDVIFEHRMYLPSAGILLTVSVAVEWGLSHLQSPYRRIVIGFLLSWTLITALSVAAYQRNTVWKDAISLWTDVVSKSPDKARGHNNLGEVYYKQGRLADAMVEIGTALRLNPDSVSAHNNLGLVYYKQGKFEEASREFLTALQWNTNALKPRLNLALVYAKQGQLEDALREYHAALKLNPDQVEAHFNLGVIYERLGRAEEARAHYDQVLRINPNFPAARKALLLLSN